MAEPSSPLPLVTARRLQRMPLPQAGLADGMPLLQPSAQGQHSASAQERAQAHVLSDLNAFTLPARRIGKGGSGWHECAHAHLRER